MTVTPGPLNSLTDVPGLLVGCAEDLRALTGVTVIAPAERAVAAVDVRGGGPATRETDALAPENLVDAVDAIVLSGGSVYGLAAADGVVARLGAEGRGYGLVQKEGVPLSPVVPGAALYDLANGGDKAWGGEPPYRALAAAALEGANDAAVRLGNFGAGCGARAGALKGGQGAASVVASSGAVIGALVAVNSFGSVLQPGTRAFWSWPFEIGAEFGGARPWDGGEGAPPFGPDDWGAAKLNPAARENTTLAVVATDVALTPSQAKRIAAMASAGLARAIRPVFAPFDGDVVFALSTGTRPIGPDPDREVALLGALAADCLARAVARGVFAAESVGPWVGYKDFSP